MEGYFIAAIVVLQPASRPRYFAGLELTPRNRPSESSKNVDPTCRPRTSIGLVLKTENGGAAAGSVIFTTGLGSRRFRGDGLKRSRATQKGIYWRIHIRFIHRASQQDDHPSILLSVLPPTTRPFPNWPD